MDITTSVTDPRQIAAINKKLAAFNAGQADADKLTVDQFIAAMLLTRTFAQWADQLAPAVIPSGEWLLRWTAAEKAWARASTDPQVRQWLVDLDAHATVDLTHIEVQQGVPYVCAAAEAAGVIATGQASTRAAAILAF